MNNLQNENLRINVLAYYFAEMEIGDKALLYSHKNEHKGLWIVQKESDNIFLIKSPNANEKEYKKEVGEVIIFFVDNRMYLCGIQKKPKFEIKYQRTLQEILMYVNIIFSILMFVLIFNMIFR